MEILCFSIMIKIIHTETEKILLAESFKQIRIGQSFNGKIQKQIKFLINLCGFISRTDNARFKISGSVFYVT